MSNGIYVSGMDLPWYVQFRASEDTVHTFSNAAGADVFKAYEFVLWDLKNDREYEIPDGEYISVTIPVKEGYTYTVEHLLDNGAMEFIVPSVNGTSLVFSTHSFSPFGIAGSDTLVGGEIAGENYNSTPTPDPAETKAPDAAQTTVAPAESGNNASSSGTTVQAAGSSQTGQNGSQTTSTGTQNVAGVRTGDDTNIAPMVIMIICAVAVIIAAIVLLLMKRRK